MGRPVVHFEITGKDGKRLHEFYSQMFDWKIDSSNEMNYGIVTREDNLSADGVGIGGGIAEGPEGYPGHVTFYVEVPDVEESLQLAEKLGGSRMMGPAEVMPDLVIGIFLDFEGHPVGLIQSTQGQ
ncbi:MAG: VOC family protein [Actinomycetota bacterium]